MDGAGQVFTLIHFDTSFSSCFTKSLRKRNHRTKNRLMRQQQQLDQSINTDDTSKSISYDIFNTIMNLKIFKY